MPACGMPKVILRFLQNVYFCGHMKECVQPYYILDGRVLDCGSFHMGLIDEGKSIYEVARLVGKRLLFLEDHLDRLFASLELEGRKSWLSRQTIREYLEKLIRENPASEGNVKFVMNLRSQKSHYFLAYFVAHRYPGPEDYKKGVKVIRFPFEREDPNKKVWRPAFRKEIGELLRKTGAFEAVLVDSQGSLPEASKANIFIVQNGTIITPPDDIILPGITRKYVLEACMKTGIPVRKEKIMLDELPRVDGLFLTGTSIHVLPVARVDELELPTGNNTMRRIMEQYESIIQDHLR